VQKQSSMKVTNKAVIDFLITKIKLGQSFDTCLKLCETKWNLTRSTFIRRWNDANKEHLEAQQAKKSKIASNDTIKAINEEIDQLMTVAERQSILASIARGELKIRKPFVVSRGATQGSEIVDHECLPDYADRKGAIAELNKMRGDYAPTKVANTDTKGNDVEHYAILPDGTKLKL